MLNTENINQILENAVSAFNLYRVTSTSQKQQLLHLIAEKLDTHTEGLKSLARLETNLSEPRLSAEIQRTALQLRSYADFMASGLSLDIRINTEKSSTLPALAKMNIPIGAVAVFGASNFPFAYSTAGGDTACALAAGCVVIEKIHPAHPNTAKAVFKLIQESLKELDLPEHIFQQVEGGFETSEHLVKHPFLAAVGFTGSYSGGKQIFDWGQQRKVPIPVFAEMGSVNPVFLLREIIQQTGKEIASKMAASISLDAGQFCTNPGIMVGIESDGLNDFKLYLKSAIEKCDPQKMLHPGIYENFKKSRTVALNHPGVEILANSRIEAEIGFADITVAETTAAYFLQHPELSEEVFGSYSLLIVCRNETEMQQVAESLQGQLTCAVFGTETELQQHQHLISILQKKLGRFICNAVPTGVRVATAMQHGGPFPASTDSRFSSVGADGIRRFMRPVCYQNWPDSLLPPELQAANPYSLSRMVDEKWEIPFTDN